MGTRFDGVPLRHAWERTDVSSGDDARLLGFESELEANLTYIPLAVRFKLDSCGIKLSLAVWQRLPEHKRRELLYLPCQNEHDVASYRRVLCVLVKECSGDEPPSIPTAEHPLWATDDTPEQIARAATALGFPSPSSAQWRQLTPLQKFALVKLSRDGHEHRNLGAALREFGLL